MPDSVTVRSSQSWFSRIGGSIKSVLVGLLLFVASFPILFWNEGRAVRTAKSLEEGAGAVVSVPADAVNAANAGKLVHMSGAVATDAPLVDPDFGVQASAVKLIRDVEMYQWKENEKSETKKKLGGGEETVTTYTYEKAWSSDTIDSASFQETSGHENPGSFPVQANTVVADPVRLGAFQLSPEQIDKLTDAQDLPVNDAMGEAIPEPMREQVQVSGGVFYMGENPSSPQIGDARIRFRVVRPSTASVVGVQTGSTFAPFQAEAGDAVLLVEEGTHGAAEMFQSAQDANKVMTWILRALGWFLMFIGLTMVFRPISVFADVVPLFGTMLGAGLGIFSFLISAALSILTIAVSWLFVRPLLGITLLVVAVAAIVWLVRLGKKKKKARMGAPVVQTA